MRFQSTLPREERLCVWLKPRFDLFISIHAPTRGATIPIGLKSFNDLISIHAPTRGATLTCLEQLQIIRAFQSTLPREERRAAHPLSAALAYFNPRSHERSDPVLSSVPLGSVPISIHAPTRGATISVFVSISSAYNFNPRSHERSDVICSKSAYL